MRRPHLLQAALALSLFLPACASHASDSPPPPVAEVRPGILTGYLTQDAYPDSLALLPPPPVAGSAAYARDVEAAQAAAGLTGTPRFEIASRDAHLFYPAVFAGLTDVLGYEVSEENTPYLARLLRRTLADAGLSTYGAKNHYQRKRPFVVLGGPTCTPDEEAMLRNDGSYPSGHTAIGWAFALVLCELQPESTDAILEWGYAFGQSRVICNVHWQSDVDAGRIMGAAAVARLHSNGEFLHDLGRARSEVASRVQ